MRQNNLMAIGYALLACGCIIAATNDMTIIPPPIAWRLHFGISSWFFGAGGGIFLGQALK